MWGTIKKLPVKEKVGSVCRESELCSKERAETQSGRRPGHQKQQWQGSVELQGLETWPWFREDTSEMLKLVPTF